MILLGGLQKATDIIIAAQSDDRKSAAQYRTDIRNEIAALRNEYHDVQSDLKLIKTKVDSMEPKVDKLEQKDFGREGAHRAAAAFGKVIQFLIAAVGGMGGGAIIDRLLHK